MTSYTFDKREQQDALEDLRKMLKPGDVVYVVQRHVSRSGMMRHLSLFIGTKGGAIKDITRAAAAAMGDRMYVGQYAGGSYLKVDGAGMNMHFAIVYSLSRTIYPDGHKCTGREHGALRCPSNDHSNDWNTASAMFDKKLVDEGRERLYGYDTEEEKAQHNERRTFIEEQMETGDLGYFRKRVHSDGGYALTHETL